MFDYNPQVVAIAEQQAKQLAELQSQIDLLRRQVEMISQKFTVKENLKILGLCDIMLCETDEWKSLTKRSSHIEAWMDKDTENKI